MKLKTTADLSREYGTCGSYVLQVLRKAGVAPRRTTTTNSRKYRFWGHDALVAMDAWKAEREARYAPDAPAEAGEAAEAVEETTAPAPAVDLTETNQRLGLIEARVAALRQEYAGDMRNLGAAFGAIQQLLGKLDTTMTQILDAVTKPSPPPTNFVIDGSLLSKPDDAH